MVSQKAVRVTFIDREANKNGFKNLQLGDIDVPQPAEGEVLVRITLRPVHPTDLMSSSGAFPHRPTPYTAGVEGVGVVETNGPGASKYSKGQRVVSGGWGDGTWQQYISVPEDKLIPVPDSLNDKTAAQFSGNPVTVVGLVTVSDVPKGQYLLQSAAGSVLGRQLIQYAKHVGIKTINIVRRQEQIAELKALGADEVIDSSTEDVVERVKQITNGEGAWAAVDAVAGDFPGKLAQCVRRGGHVRVYGFLSGTSISFAGIDSILGMVCNGAYLSGFSMLLWLDGDGPEKAAQRLQLVMDLLSEGVMTPLSGRAYELEQVHEAIAASQQDGHGAKVFLSG